MMMIFVVGGGRTNAFVDCSSRSSSSGSMADADEKKNISTGEMMAVVNIMMAFN